MSNDPYMNTVPFSNVTETTAKLLKGTSLSNTASQVWNDAGGALLGMLGQDAIKTKLLTPNLSFKCLGCDTEFMPKQMSINYADGTVSAGGDEWRLSSLQECPLCGNDSVQVCVKPNFQYSLPTS